MASPSASTSSTISTLTTSTTSTSATSALATAAGLQIPGTDYILGDRLDAGSFKEVYPMLLKDSESGEYVEDPNWLCKIIESDDPKDSNQRQYWRELSYEGRICKKLHKQGERIVPSPHPTIKRGKIEVGGGRSAFSGEKIPPSQRFNYLVVERMRCKLVEDRVHDKVRDVWRGDNNPPNNNTVNLSGVAVEMVRLLETFHKKANMVYSDFKAENVMVGSDGKLRLIDMGLAVDICESESKAVSEGRVAGTLSTMAITAHKYTGHPREDLESALYVTMDFVKRVSTAQPGVKFGGRNLPWCHKLVNNNMKQTFELGLKHKIAAVGNENLDTSSFLEELPHGDKFRDALKLVRSCKWGQLPDYDGLCKILQGMDVQVGGSVQSSANEECKKGKEGKEDEGNKGNKEDKDDDDYSSDYSSDDSSDDSSDELASLAVADKSYFLGKRIGRGLNLILKISGQIVHLVLNFIKKNLSSNRARDKGLSRPSTPKMGQCYGRRRW